MIFQKTLAIVLQSNSSDGFFGAQTNPVIKLLSGHFLRSWSRGLMDKALASGAGDCGFESHRDRAHLVA